MGHGNKEMKKGSPVVFGGTRKDPLSWTVYPSRIQILNKMAIKRVQVEEGIRQLGPAVGRTRFR
jgi:hypothetical protein